MMSQRAQHLDQRIALIAAFTLPRVVIHASIVVGNPTWCETKYVRHCPRFVECLHFGSSFFFFVQGTSCTRSKTLFQHGEGWWGSGSRIIRGPRPPAVCWPKAEQWPVVERSSSDAKPKPVTESILFGVASGSGSTKFATTFF